MENSSTSASNTKTPMNHAAISEIRNLEDDQAVIFDCVADFELEQYLHAMKKFIGGSKNVIAASKINENQIQVHLKSIEILNEFFNSTGGRFEIESNNIQCRRANTPKTKILLSHVNPGIPDSVLIKYIKEDLKLEVSKMGISYVPVNPKDVEFDHVISWQRQFFTKSQITGKDLPKTLIVKYKRQKYRIFLTIEDESNGQSGCRAENYVNVDSSSQKVKKEISEAKSTCHPSIVKFFSLVEFSEPIDLSARRENMEIDATNEIIKRPLFKNLNRKAEKKRKRFSNVKNIPKSDWSTVVIKHIGKKETHKNNKTSDNGHKLKSFLILKKEASSEHPNIWRIQDKFKIQKFEHYEQEGRHLYRSTAEFGKYSDNEENKYQEVDVTVIEEKNDKLIIELCDDTEIPTDLKIKENFMKESLCYEHQFAVYIQTLVSQALDSNFLSEIVKENDTYFLSNMKVIDEVTATYLTDLTGVVKWKNNSLNILVKTWPFISIKSIRGESTKSKCTSCNETNSKQTAIFYGQQYQRETLQGCKANSSIPDDMDKTVDLCRSCSQEIRLFHKIWHQKYHTFIECAKYVSKKKSEDKSKGTTDILNELLSDTNWLSKLFYDIRNTWLQIWTIVQKSKDS